MQDAAALPKKLCILQKPGQQKHSPVHLVLCAGEY